MPFFEPDEGRNAEVAREMLVTHRWLTPHYEGLPYLDKPSLYFWFVAGSFEAFGLNEAAGRLPSALAALGVLILAWWLARDMFGAPTALRAGLALVTAPLMIAFARIVIFDMPLTFFVTLAMVCYWKLGTSGVRPRALEALMWSALGLATFMKGPVGFIVPLLSIVVYEIARGRFRELRKLRWVWGVPLMLAFVLPWFIAVSLRHPDFPHYALWTESLERFATSHADRGGAFYYYVPVYFAAFFPWSFFLLYAGFNRLRSWRSLRDERNAAALYLLAWAGTIFVFFSISRSKLPGYFLPALVPLSLLMGLVWRRRPDDPATRAPDWLTAGFATLMLLGLGAILLAELAHYGVLPQRWEAKLPPDVAALIGPALIVTGVILTALGWLGRDFAARARQKAPSRAAFSILALTVPLIAVRWAPLLVRDAADHSSRRLARTILESPERNLPIYGYFYFRTSLPFYLRRKVAVVTGSGVELTSNYISDRYGEFLREERGLTPRSGSHSAARPSRAFLKKVGEILISPREWRSRIGLSPMLMLVRNDQIALLTAAAGEMQPLWSAWDYSVWEIPARSKRQSASRPGPG